MCPENQGHGVCRVFGEYQLTYNISVTNSRSDVVLSCLTLSDHHGAKSSMPRTDLEGKGRFFWSFFSSKTQSHQSTWNIYCSSFTATLQKNLPVLLCLTEDFDLLFFSLF